MSFKNITLAAASLATLALASCGGNSPDQWPDGGREAKPAARWWWMGSAVDSANLQSLIAQYAESGLGGLEICPIYGVQGNDSADIPFLSERWMQVYAYAKQQSEANGIRLDMTCGTGWPFGGPNVTVDYAAARLQTTELAFESQTETTVEWDTRLENVKHRRGATLVDVFAFNAQGEKTRLTDRVEADTLRWTAPAGAWHIYALWHGHTFQAVKRAAPGGEGLVMDYFNKEAVDHYLGRFDTAFAQAKMPFPQMMFSDSYEVYGADYTQGLFDSFEKMHGYRAEDYLPALLDNVDTDLSRRVRADYCETVDSLLRNCFLQNWVDWLHKNNSTSREQAHGSVANLLDLYALSDVPECETYGRAKVQIRDLVVPDTFQRKNESDKSIMKFASSGAHVMGKKLTSAESLTWASEHFRMTPALCKPELDALFLAGINKIFYHGAAYSPAQAEWPGWKFYASVDYSPTNVFWPELKELNTYVYRTQSFMQDGVADADVLVYFPMFDVWYNQNRKYLNLSIENLQVVAPWFLSLITEVENAGFQTDYISDRQILGLSTRDGRIYTQAGVEYKTIVIPATRFMHADVLQHLQELAAAGATIVFSGNYPSEAPGLSPEGEKKAMADAVAALPTFSGKANSNAVGRGRIITAQTVREALTSVDDLTVETMTADGLRYIRRRNADGYTYFIANLDLADIDAKDVMLGVEFADAVFYEPLSGRIGRAGVNEQKRLRIQLESGETVILRTYNKAVSVPEWNYRASDGLKSLKVENGWKVSFAESVPAIDPAKVFDTDTICWWTELPDTTCLRNSGVAVYSSSFAMEAQPKAALLRLHNVKDAATVTVNGQALPAMWSFPYVADITSLVKEGENTISVAVRGSAANRIAQMERDGIVWRKFKDTNLLDVKGKRRDFAWWPIEPQGLKGPVVIEFE